ncbi:MAG TPA: 16S rRNA (cytosine(1402)-N(4))-methyltransferase RsmH [Candidatus Limnocylindria bacterium]|jgi:16S rRNA (cytosine1402-N4)-methyltransferase|nr:16S rRNA (cytosine(1402)-N(4))-methyltransferase RsmH [Candidatus Limnocylindria bacterium]
MNPTDPPASDPVRPKRRVRYAGKNPRRFDEKYKERDPARYAGDVAKVLASGKTPAGSHRPIMVAEILEALALKPGALVVDCTLGYGGHARELLGHIAPGGRLIGLDVDPIEQPKTVERLRAAGFGEDVFTPVRRNFAGLAQVLAELGLKGADAILADLGVSSMQLDDPARGFTFKDDGPLDLRLNPQRAPSAAELLATIRADKFATLLVENADEPHADVLARELVAARGRAPITRTRQLAEVLREILVRLRLARDRDTDNTCIRRVFQALRIAVNDEFGVLDAWLRHLPSCLRPGGRVAVLTFHSGEDRRVKKAFQEGARSGVYAAIADEVVRPSAEELRANSRSAPAKLRWAIRA